MIEFFIGLIVGKALSSKGNRNTNDYNQFDYDGNCADNSDENTAIIYFLD